MGAIALFVVLPRVGAAKGDTPEPKIDPEPKSPVEQTYDRAQDNLVEKENDVLLLTDRIRNFKTSPSGQGQLIAELEDELVGAKQSAFKRSAGCGRCGKSPA